MIKKKTSQQLKKMNRTWTWKTYDSEGFEFLVEYLTEVHSHRLVDLLPQMGTENLDERDLQCRNLTVKEDTRQIKLHLETDIDVGSVDSRRPPEGEASVKSS
jgi:phage gp16-like protein